MLKVGSKIQVYNGSAERTKGGLTKNDLLRNKRGKIVSKAQYENGLRAAANLKTS